MVLLWPLVTGRPAAAVADEPPPYYDCQGKALTPEEFDALVERLAEIAAGYGQVFTVPFGYCDEGPLVIEGLPAECTFSQGWRNYLSDSPEAFLLAPLDVVLFTIDELIANGLLIEPEDAQVLRQIDFRMGYLAGAVATPRGEAGFHGALLTGRDATGTWSAWFVLGALRADELATAREIEDCLAGGVRDSAHGYTDDRYRYCDEDWARCMDEAAAAYNQAIRAANAQLRLCWTGLWTVGLGAFIACIASLAKVGVPFQAAVVMCGISYAFAGEVV